MRAWQVKELGDPSEVLHLVEKNKPTNEPNKVLIKVESASMNYFEILLCRGEYQETSLLPFTPGAEVSGVVMETNKKSKFKVGQKVLAQPQLPNGGLAEYTLVPEQYVYVIPEFMNWNDASAIFLTYQTSYYALCHRAELKKNQTLLIHAGAGGVGSAAIQIGKALGAKVIATAGGREKTKICYEIGADIVIDYLKENFVEKVKYETNEEGVDVIYDPVGGDTFNSSTKCIAFGGKILVVGFASGIIPEIKTNHALIKNYSIIGVHWGYYRKLYPKGVNDIHQVLMEMYKERKIKPLIFDQFTLKEVPYALSLIKNRKTWGKLIIKP